MRIQLFLMTCVPLSLGWQRFISFVLVERRTMRIGILADIHGHVGNLRKVIARLRLERVDLFVVLGDVIDNGVNASETVAMLKDCEAVGVFGNHELGLCVDPEGDLRARCDDWIADSSGI